MTPKRVSTPLRLSSHNTVQPARLATDATAMLAVAAHLDHLDPQVNPEKLELQVNEESPVFPVAPEADHQLQFRPVDAVFAPLDLMDLPAHPAPLEPTAKPVHPETPEAMEPLATLEHPEAPDPPEMLAALDPLEPPDKLARPEPPADLDLLDQKAHLDQLDLLDSLDNLDQTAKPLLDPLELPDPLEPLVAMETLDPLDQLEPLALLDPMPSIVLAQAKANDLKWRRGCVGESFGLLSNFSPLFFLFFLFSIRPNGKIVV